MKRREKVLGALIEREEINFRLEIWAYRELTPAEAQFCLDAYLRQCGTSEPRNLRARFDANFGLEPGL
jgi:hypothetical protein